MPGSRCDLDVVQANIGVQVGKQLDALKALWSLMTALLLAGHAREYM